MVSRRSTRTRRPMLEQLEARNLLSTWSTVTSPNPSTHGDVLLGVAAISATDAWAVGSTDEVTQAQSKTIAQHWNGTQWTTVASANPGRSSSLNAGNVLNAVAAVSSNNVWAVGFYWKDSLFKTLIEHYDGRRWAQVSSPNPGATGNNVLQAVSVVSANDIWAVGYYENDIGASVTLTMHYNGSGWSVVSSPSPDTGNALRAVTAVASNDVWAVGYYYESATGLLKTLTEHYNGSSWSIVSSPSPGAYFSNILNGVTAVSATNVWAVGNYEDSSSGATDTLLEHWDGASWSQVTSPNVNDVYGSQNKLNGVTAISASNIWAVGFYRTPDISPNHQALTMHYDGASWTIVSAPSPGPGVELNAVAAGGGNVWAVGAYSIYGNSSDYGGLIVPKTFIIKTPTTFSSGAGASASAAPAPQASAVPGAPVTSPSSASTSAAAWAAAMNSLTDSVDAFFAAVSADGVSVPRRKRLINS